MATYTITLNDICIYSTIWRRELFVGVFCLAAVVMTVIYDATKLPIVLFLGPMGLYLLYNVFRERLLHRPYLTITDESIIINRKGHEETTIRFDEIKSFERETLTIWKYTKYSGYIIIHLKDDNGFVHVINADNLAIKAQVLYDLLNERLKPLH